MQKIYPDQPRTVSGAQFPMGQGHIPGQPVHVPTEHPVHVLTGQPVHDPTRQPVQSVPGPGVLVQPPLNQPRAGRMNKAHLKTMLGCSRILEFVLLLIASPCGVAYSNRTFVWNSRASFFAGVSIFSWIMVIVLLIAFLLGIHKDRRYFRTPSYASLIILVVQVFMTILLIASTTSLAMPGVELYKAGKRHRELYGEEKTFDVNDVFLGFALAGGVSACLCFVDDIPQLIKMYRLQRAEEIAAANNTQ